MTTKYMVTETHPDEADPFAPVTIRIEVQKGASGLLYATSPDNNGLLVAAHDQEELATAVPLAIRRIYGAEGRKVTVEATAA